MFALFGRLGNSNADQIFVLYPEESFQSTCETLQTGLGWSDQITESNGWMCLKRCLHFRAGELFPPFQPNPDDWSASIRFVKSLLQGLFAH